LLVRCAQQFQADIKIEKAGNRVDGKSILEILMLAAEAGTDLVIHAQGTDAQSALDALGELFDHEFHVEEQESNTANSHTAGENLP
jgi:phosphotransferase system HPr (HPr) family protein